MFTFKPLAPDGAAARFAPFFRALNLSPPPGNAVNIFRAGISRFGVSHGCAGGTVANAKTADGRSRHHQFSFTALPNGPNGPTGLKLVRYACAMSHKVTDFPEANN